MRQEQGYSAKEEAANTSEYEGYFSDLDEEVYDKCDEIESLHNSPTKEFSSLSHSSFSSVLSNKSASGNSLQWASKDRNADVSSSTSHRTSPYPSTPTRKQTAESPAGTREGRFSAVRKGFMQMGINSPTPPTPKKLFPEASANTSTVKGKKPRKVVVIDDSDEDSQEVSSILTDTDTSDGWAGNNPFSPQGSLSSIGSGWSLPSASSFGLTASSSKKRIGDSQGSPSKYRKLTDREAPNGKETTSRPQVADDVFSSPSSSAGEPAPRNDGWNLHASDGESALESFLSGPLGVDLTPSIIAHDAEVQSLFDKEKISWGVQWEIARGVSRGHWAWSDVKPKIGQLRGSIDKIAPRVRSIMLDQLHKPYDPAIWQELDREQDAIMENCERGLGLMGTWREEADWYGGKVQQLARLVSHEGTYKVHLDPMEKRRSYRLARYLGSRRVLQLRIPDDMAKKEGAEIKEFLLQKFVLCGRVFVPYFAKENGVYLVETNENHERRPAEWAGDQHRRSFKDIINWHNALELNMDQPISKWSTRFALAFSDSIPVLEFREENIHAIDDIYAFDWLGPGKAPAEKIHTDGCGLINEAALKIIARALNALGRPTAVQGRLMGSKGMWILHPTDKDPEPRIWIRPSQTKIMYEYPLDRAHCIFDLLSISRFSPSIKLSKQSIMNLSENGVSDDVLTDLMVQGLADEVRPLMKWHGAQAMEALWNSINQLGGVSRTRLQRVTAGLSRVLGLQRREWGHEDIGMEDAEETSAALAEEQDTGGYTGRNEISGAPLAIHELTLELIQAGFRPDELKLLKEKIRYIVQTTISSIVEKFSIPLPESFGAYVVPDPLGVLEEGEVYYRSSQSLTDPETQTLFNVVTGEILLGRYPVRLPSDIQKVKAVDRPELFNYPDVLIVSTKGAISLASLLSGGDCDGDELFGILAKIIVEMFKDKPLTAMPPNLLADYFEGHPERVKQFADRVAAMSSHDAQKAFQEILLLNLTDAKVGLYSTFHDFAVWRYGYADPRSVRLAYMFNTLLDSSKTGLRLKQGVFEKDQALFGGEVPQTRSQNSRPFIFHTLFSAGKVAADELLRDYDILAGNMSSDNGEAKDEDLLRPYSCAKANAGRTENAYHQVLADELERIKAVVKGAKDAHQKAKVRLVRAKSPTKKSKRAIQREADPMLHVSQLYDQDVPDVFLYQNVREIKASYAYELDSGFAFTVAFRDLCDIKAHASFRGIAPTTRSFDEAKSISSTYVKALARLTMDRL